MSLKEIGMRRSSSRRKAPAVYQDINVSEWLEKHPDYLISCPNQPGNLRISQESCVKRYLKANEPRWANIGAEPFPIFVFKMNLIPCRNCEVGARLAERREERAA